MSLQYIYKRKSNFIVFLSIVSFFFNYEHEKFSHIPNNNNIEIVLIFFGSSTCPASNDPAIPRVFKNLKLKINKYANDRGFRFKSIGVSLDQDMELGFNFLRKVDSFDEISIGPNLNIASQVYVYKNNFNVVSPQILVIVREFNSDLPSLKYMSNTESVVYKSIGAYGIYLTNTQFNDLVILLDDSTMERNN